MTEITKIATKNSVQKSREAAFKQLTSFNLKGNHTVCPECGWNNCCCGAGG